jgi:glucarate dehydratase
MADIRRITGVPIEAHSHGPNCLEYVRLLVEKRAADAIHLNVSFTGGVMEAKRVCAVAEAGGLIATGQSSAAELGPRNALLLHLITSERAFKGTNDSSTHHLTGDIIKEEFTTVNGTLKVPEGPGLGVEIDEEKLRKYNELYRSGLYRHEEGIGRKELNLWY